MRISVKKMFIDTLFDKLLLSRGLTVEETFAEMCVIKLTEDKSLLTVKRIENGYQLFRKRHPEFKEDAFRSYVRRRSPEVAIYCGW